MQSSKSFLIRDLLGDLISRRQTDSGEFLKEDHIDILLITVEGSEEGRNQRTVEVFKLHTYMNILVVN